MLFLMSQIQQIRPAPSKGGCGNHMLSVDAVAALYEVSKSTVYRWINNEGLPTFKFPGNGIRGILRIAEDELHLWRERFHQKVEEASDSEKTLTLEGRRFTSNKNSESFSQNKLDPRNRPASRVPVEKKTELR